MKGTSKIDDFDFLIGQWKVANRKLKERLSGSNEWIEFGGELVVRKTLNGYANVDDFKCDFNGVEINAVTLRVFNPKEKLWSIYWLDNLSYEMIPQVKGNFKEGSGEFYGQELFNGKTVNLKFTWTKTSNELVHWNQAYYDDSSDDWEINWIMDFTKIN